MAAHHAAKNIYISMVQPAGQDVLVAKEVRVGPADVAEYHRNLDK